MFPFGWQTRVKTKEYQRRGRLSECHSTLTPFIYLAGEGARRGGGVSGIAGHNAAMALILRRP